MDCLVGKRDLDHGSLLNRLTAPSIERLHHDRLCDGYAGEQAQRQDQHSKTTMTSQNHNFRTVLRSIRFS